MDQKMTKSYSTDLTSLSASELVNYDIPVSVSMDLIAVRGLGTPPISQLTREAGKESAINYIKKSIVELTMQFGQAWNDYQISTAASDFYSRFYYWRMADLKRFILGCRVMEYGQLYGHFQPQHIMEWAQQYDQSWTAASEQISIEQASQYKQRKDNDRALKDFLNVRD